MEPYRFRPFGGRLVTPQSLPAESLPAGPRRTPRARIVALAAIAVVWVPPAAIAQTPTDAPEAFEDGALYHAAARAAVDAGHRYLRSKRQPKNWYGENRDFQVAVTALTGLSFLAGGHVPGRGEYGKEVEAAVAYFLELAERGSSKGYLAEAEEKSKMHGHGYATLFLAEVYGMTRDEATRVRIGLAIEGAVKCIVDAQESRPGELGEMGGWGYEPNDSDRSHEGSITVCCLQALRAARDVGFKVPKHTLVKAIRYLIASQNPDGSFLYRIGGGRSHSTLPLTAAAIATMNAFGVYDDTTTRILGEDLPQLPDCMRKGLAFIDRRVFIGDEEDRYYQNFWFYAEYYASQVYYKSRFPGAGRQWNKYYARTRDKLLDPQDDESHYDERAGYWRSDKYGNAYATATATLILQIPLRYLPIFQR